MTYCIFIFIYLKQRYFKHGNKLQASRAVHTIHIRYAHRYGAEMMKDVNLGEMTQITSFPSRPAPGGVIV